MVLFIFDPMTWNFQGQSGHATTMMVLDLKHVSLRVAKRFITVSSSECSFYHDEIHVKKIACNSPKRHDTRLHCMTTPYTMKT